MIRTFITNAYPDWTILEASNAQEALEKTATLIVDAMTLDLNMPGVDGLSLAAQFKTKYPKAQITLLTANIQDSVRHRAAAAGVGFMAKPITEDNILAFLAGVEHGRD
jgi:CheY-like chemotaxis protein